MPVTTSAVVPRQVSWLRGAISYGGNKQCEYESRNLLHRQRIYILRDTQMIVAGGNDIVSVLLKVFDLSGTFVFALSGAMAAVKHRLDLFGVLVLSFTVGNVGGITRDVVIGAVPPAAILDWRYVAVSVLAGLVTFYWFRALTNLSGAVLVFDAAGLALFAVAGANKALAFHAGPLGATLLGMLTGIGGGMARDVLLREIPVVLRTELYAVAALVGAGVVVLAEMLHLPQAVGAIVGALLCFGLRVLSIRYGWQLPIARPPGDSMTGGNRT